MTTDDVHQNDVDDNPEEPTVDLGFDEDEEGAIPPEEYAEEKQLNFDVPNDPKE